MRKICFNFLPVTIPPKDETRCLVMDGQGALDIAIYRGGQWILEASITHCFRDEILENLAMYEIIKKHE